MTEREFCFWLRGYICDRDMNALNKRQLKTIKRRLLRLSTFVPQEETPTPPSEEYTVYS